ncbi:DUF3291 domain-containing protein [Aquimarina algiphila]|uniref:DUF3291 domain-containing protein n=1 Tax=Aquimarina algiphila TaxID=2047982 RepID=UPI00232E8D91|nr:DUF3291 domain-containing protein [Aquimarina algiphila]
MKNNLFHIAQFNIIKLKDELDSPMILEFKDFLAPVNKLAEKSPGFIWRLKDDGGGSATNIETPYKDKLIFVNLSVWLNFEDLENYVYRTVHGYFLKSRKKWGIKMEGYQSVLWWKQAGDHPTVMEGKTKLDLLNTIGSSPQAFSINEKYDNIGIKL